MPSFKGYRGFPGSICASPNAMVVHGIPGPYRLARGDVISIDIGVTLDGWVADGARTFAVGQVSPVAEKLLEVTEQSLFDAVEQARPGNRLGDISHAVQARVEGEGMSVVRSLVGHGIGREMHEDPQVPNYGEPGRGPLLEEGMVLAIEPMVTAGRHAVRMGDDGWAIFSQDGSLAAHFEFTVAITADGPADPHAVARAGGRRQTRLSGLARSGRGSRFATVSGPRARRPCCPCTSARGSGGPMRQPEPIAGPSTKKEHEGTTVGQADVREVQDHPPPWRGSRDLPEPAPQAAPGVIG